MLQRWRQRLKCWIRGYHQGTEPLIRTYTEEYRSMLLRCQDCGAEKWRGSVFISDFENMLAVYRNQNWRFVSTIEDKK